MGGIDIIEGATLTIEAGVEIRFNASDWLEVGAGGSPGRLIAKGTPDAPIILTSGSADMSKTWLGLWFHSGTLEGSVLSHAVVKRGGGENRLFKPALQQGCITLTDVKANTLQLDHVQAEHCINGGLRLADSHVQIGELRVVDTEIGIVADPTSRGSIGSEVSYQNVARNLIEGRLVETMYKGMAFHGVSEQP